MACDSTYRSSAIPLAFFRMLRDERKRRQSLQNQKIGHSEAVSKSEQDQTLRRSQQV